MNYQDIFRIKEKTAIITGAASGIGKGLAEAFCSLGCNVVVVDVNKDAVEALVNELKSQGGQALGAVCDVSKSDSVIEAVKNAVDKLGRIDILVNNAGIGKRAKAEEMTDDEWNTVLDINLKGTFFFCREVGKQMIAQGDGGRIINMASVSAIVGLETGNANYTASKGGMVAMGRCLAVEWAKHNILVNTIVPSHTRTPLIDKLIKQKPEIKEYFLNNILLGRLGEIDDLVGPAVFLSSKASEFMTGQVLIVDGGHTAK